ncbi:MAG: hypothetical protein ACREFZ_09740 [Acetobacteraceae bacterium]
MHAPTVRLREAAAENKSDLLAAAHTLFDLDAEGEHSNSEAA